MIAGLSSGQGMLTHAGVPQALMERNALERASFVGLQVSESANSQTNNLGLLPPHRPNSLVTDGVPGPLGRHASAEALVAQGSRPVPQETNIPLQGLNMSLERNQQQPYYLHMK